MVWNWLKSTGRAAAVLLALPAQAAQDDSLAHARQPALSFISFPSPNLAAPGTTLTIQGKLSLPAHAGRGAGHGHRKLPAVLILHGSAGIDARGDFYEAALNAAGIATLQIDMWQARGVTTAVQRPNAPVLTYPDAFSALAYLAQRPEIDGTRVGVLGFSWGGLVSLGAAERLYAGRFGGGRTFKAHVAHYPVCYAWNNTALLATLNTTPAQFGVQWLNLTGAPVMIQIGSRDDYDKGSAACQALAQSANASNGNVVSVNSYPGATHGWDRLMVPMTVTDPYADQGSYFRTGVLPSVQFTPDAEQAWLARSRVVRFFERQL
ncbi:dienelactone hydrolase family protein [Mitsuaria sp. WAJ17]|uniref:dienelactone hydrolase family protein n=1 Tax=Mitsuaria sp. WAJ17 TaxID=2761452 RepID=UPI001601AFB2|nr:dienelactone hydrolase family protein [Mitsuaria sp. WAJ17]MBB2484576.1 dienelactone hydrolase family protein [Mitsuaria sp. WAJ17]